MVDHCSYTHNLLKLKPEINSGLNGDQSCLHTVFFIFSISARRKGTDTKASRTVKT